MDSWFQLISGWIAKHVLDHVYGRGKIVIKWLICFSPLVVISRKERDRLIEARRSLELLTNTYEQLRSIDSKSKVESPDTRMLQ